MQGDKGGFDSANFRVLASKGDGKSSLAWIAVNFYEWHMIAGINIASVTVQEPMNFPANRLIVAYATY